MRTNPLIGDVGISDGTRVDKKVIKRRQAQSNKGAGCTQVQKKRQVQIDEMASIGNITDREGCCFQILVSTFQLS